MIRIYQDGKEIDITQLNKDFATNFLKENIFGKLVMATLKIAIEGLKDESELKQEVQEEVISCSGNPENCPVCNPDVADVENPFLSNFSEALTKMKEGAKVTRRAWLGLDVDYLYLTKDNIAFYPSFFIQDTEGKAYTYTFQHDDLTAEDWLLIND